MNSRTVDLNFCVFKTAKFSTFTRGLKVGDKLFDGGPGHE